MKNKLNQNDCAHVIGLLHHTEYSELTTVDGLLKHIHDRRLFNEMILGDPFFEGFRHKIRPIFTVRDYGDRRRSTNLTHFEHCPVCGAKIDWKAIRQIES